MDTRGGTWCPRCHTKWHARRFVCPQPKPYGVCGALLVDRAPKDAKTKPMRVPTPKTPLQQLLERMDRRDFVEYKAALARGDVHQMHPGEELGFTASEPGHPLGRGYPLGRALRRDGQTHREWWMHVLRQDPCSYCGGPGGTIDHIEPRSKRVRGIGGAHSWLNYTGSCQPCNGRKSVRKMLLWMRSRHRHRKGVVSAA